ncbi:MAG: hypothetical protein ACLFPJ_04465 [Candidatus Woesearchaeota archaeon]
MVKKLFFLIFLLIIFLFLIGCLKKFGEVSKIIRYCDEKNICREYEVLINLPLVDREHTFNLLEQLNKTVKLNEEYGGCFFIDSKNCWYYLYPKSLNTTKLIQNVWIFGEIDVFTGNIIEQSALKK